MALTTSLSGRLRLGIAAIVAIFVLAGAISVLGIISSAAEVTRIVDSSGPTFAALDEMQASILTQQVLLVDYSRSGAPGSVEAIAQEREVYAAARNRLVSLWQYQQGLDLGLSEAYADYNSRVDTALGVIADRLRLIDGRGTPKEIAAATSRVNGFLASVASSRQSLAKSFDKGLRLPVQAAFEDARKEASRAAWRSLIVLGLLTILAILVAVVIGRRMMRTIRQPLSRLVEGMDLIASGNKGARLEAVGLDEFADLESGFNDMAERLEDAEAGLSRAYAAQRKLLDEVPVGFLTLGPDFKVGPEYSLATEAMLGHQNLAGLSFVDLLLPLGAEGQDLAVQGLSRYLKQLFNNTTADLDFLRDLNPVSTFTLGEGEDERILTTRFDRLYAEGKVTDLLVTLEDRTSTVHAEQALDAERMSHKRDADSIQAILSIGPGPLKDFFEETREDLARIRADLGDLARAETVHRCFRALHSIKGAAGSFGIKVIASTAHSAEELFAQLRDSGRGPTPQEVVRINLLLGEISQELSSFEEFVQRLKSTMLRLELEESAGRHSGELENFLKSLEPMVSQLEVNLSKPILLKLDIKAKEVPHLKELKSIIIHLIRNAADHGLEDEFERLFRGKDKLGTIRLYVGPSPQGPGAWLVEVEDDGQGLDFDKIAARARDRGLLAQDAPLPPKARLLSYLFMPGFSTKDKVDEISGRGVGLDLVRDLVKGFGGKISVSSQPGKGSKFSVTIPA